MVNPESARVGYEAWPILGEMRRVGLVFLSPEGAEIMRTARKCYLWEGKTVGAAVVVDGDSLGEALSPPDAS